MDKIEADAVLAAELSNYRKLSYGDLVKLAGENAVSQVRGASGVEYQLEIQVMWDSPRQRTVIRVLGGIDDGILPGAMLPLCQSFLMAPDGTFVDE